MKNPLCSYHQFLDAIDFLENNFVCLSGNISVPFADRCYFSAPLFYKFNFHLNFFSEEPYCFWKAFKESRSLLAQTMDVFKKYPIVDNFDEDVATLQEMMAQETRPMLKALLYLYCSDRDFERNFNSSLSLNLDKVSITQNQLCDPSDFILHSFIDDFSLNDGGKFSTLNEYKSKIIIHNNPSIEKFIDHEHKIEFKDCAMLVSSR